MNTKDAEVWAEAVADVVREYVERKIAPLEREISELQRLAGVDHRRSVSDSADAWVECSNYEKGSVVRYLGSVWECCLSNHGMRPGDGAAWRRRA